MSLIGRTLKHHVAPAPLGKGGMEEVNRANDGKPGCDVAIKVLPGESAKDAA